ncbi:MAG: 6-phosphofructokinase [Verrucomicrobiota bacterium]
MSKKRIGVLTSGGDCPGLNAVIRGVVLAAANRNWEVIGFNEGYEGMLSPVRYRKLNRQHVSGIERQGGTILGTTNHGRFVSKVRHGEKATLPPDVIEEAKETIEGLGIEALVCIGGDGSLTTAQQLFEAGFNVVGVPKTIDNDISATATSFGFDSAVACVVDALDRLQTTTYSHKRVMVVEVMGRYAGWIALHSGVAGAADVILIPEIPFEIQKVADVVMKREAEGEFSTMIVVAEGAHEKDGTYVAKQDNLAAASPGEIKLGGIGSQVAKHIAFITKKEARYVVLGHLQRGGAPTEQDRLLSTRFGVTAVQLIDAGKNGHMVTYHNDIVDSVPIIDAVSRLKTIQPNDQIVKTAREVGIKFGDE